MHLFKQVSIAGREFSLINSDVRLSLFTPGRAIFEVVSEERLEGVVIFTAGYSPENTSHYFIGYVESCTQASKNKMRLFCRELSAVLFNRAPISLREASLVDVLAKVSELTRLDFKTPGKGSAYETKLTPVFYNISNGYHALDSLARVFNIQKFVYYQDKSGKVFVGSWEDSSFASTPVELPQEFEKMSAIANGAEIPAIPPFRPGVSYNGNIITSVKFAGAKMVLDWAADPWVRRG